MDIKDFIRSASPQQLREAKRLLDEAVESLRPDESPLNSEKKSSSRLSSSEKSALMGLENVTASLSGFKIVTDGASRGNPGHAGAGMLIFDEKNKKVFEDAQYLGITTNNEAEYRALMLALDHARRFTQGSIVCVMDSELVVKQMKGLYSIKSEKMMLLNQQVRKKCVAFKAVQFMHVPREHSWLRMADALANRGIDEKKGEGYGR